MTTKKKTTKKQKNAIKKLRVKYIVAILVAIFGGALAVNLLAGDAMPVGQTGSWNLVFEDNFDGTTLNFSKWKPNWFGATDMSITYPINTYEQNCYNPANVSVGGGVITFTTIPNTDTACKKRGEAVATYSSGMISSNYHYSFTYGYIEASIWNPAGIDHKSVWPAFWTAGQNWPTDGEIDIMECYGTDASCSYHYHYNSNGTHQGPGGNATVVGSTTGYHTYAANWELGKVTWYYDGVQVWQYTTGIISVPHYIIANLATYGTQVVTPATMKVDYIRVWKRGTDAIPTITATKTSTATRTAIPNTNTPVPVTKTPTATITKMPTFTQLPVTWTSLPPTLTITPSATSTVTPLPIFTVTPLLCDPEYLPLGICIYKVQP